MAVVIGAWLIGEASPTISRRNVDTDDLLYLAELKGRMQRTAIIWLSGLAASVVGAYKLKDVVDLIIKAVS